MNAPDYVRNPPLVYGYCAVFNEYAQFATVGRETIKPGAFTGALAAGANIQMWINHDETGPVLAQTSDGTLRLVEDHIGLYFEAWSRSAALHVKAGLNRCSIQRGQVSKGTFTDDGTGFLTKETFEIPVIIEVSLCAYPRYRSTWAQLTEAGEAVLSKESEKSKRSEVVKIQNVVSSAKAEIEKLLKDRSRIDTAIEAEQKGVTILQAQLRNAVEVAGEQEAAALLEGKPQQSRLRKEIVSLRNEIEEREAVIPALRRRRERNAVEIQAVRERFLVTRKAAIAEALAEVKARYTDSLIPLLAELRKAGAIEAMLGEIGGHAFVAQFDLAPFCFEVMLTSTHPVDNPFWRDDPDTMKFHSGLLPLLEVSQEFEKVCAAL